MTTTTTTTPAVEFVEVESTVEEIPTAFADRIARKLKALTKRLAKLGVPAPSIEFGPVIAVEYPVESEPVPGVPAATFPAFETVTVRGFEAKVAGFTGVAVLDWTVNPDEAFVARFPGHDDEESAPEISDELRTRGPVCDHCDKKRSRNLTILFENEDGGMKAVGTSCVLEYLGVDPRTILMLSDFVKSVSDDEDFGSTVKPALDPMSFVALAAEVTRAFGFVRSGEAGSTKELVTMLGILGPRSKYEKELAAELAAEADTDRGMAKAEAIAAWLDEDTSNSDFLRSARVALGAPAVEAGARHAGILAALPFSHDRHIGLVAEREAKRKAEAEARKTGGFVGKVGDKVTVKGEVTFYNTYDGTYGTSVRLTVLTDGGDKVTTYGSGNSLFGWGSGDKVEFTGKVKSLDDDPKWGKSTVFERVKVKELGEDGNPLPECSASRCDRPGRACDDCGELVCVNGHGRGYGEGTFYCETCLDKIWEAERERAALATAMVRAASAMLGSYRRVDLYSVDRTRADKVLEGAGVA